MNLVLCRESLLEPLEVGGMKQHFTYIDRSHVSTVRPLAHGLIPHQAIRKTLTGF